MVVTRLTRASSACASRKSLQRRFCLLALNGDTGKMDDLLYDTMGLTR